MITVLVLADARARGVSLPADDDVAQDIIDEQSRRGSPRASGRLPAVGPRPSTWASRSRTDASSALGEPPTA
jgi:hypothetical protein